MEIGSVEEWLVRSLSKHTGYIPALPSLLFVRSLLDDEVGITTCSRNAATERMGGMVRQTSPLWGVPKDILPTDRIAAARALLAGYVIVCTYSRNIRAPS